MSAATDSPGRGRYIGRGLPRPGAKRLLAGRGRYTDDVVLPRMLHAAFLRSPYAHARLGAIETAEAAAMPGVHAVLTGADFARICAPWTGTLSHFKGLRSAPQRPLPTDRVVWAGQPVVMVVAESRAEAEDALEVIGIDFAELEMEALARGQGNRRWECHGQGAVRARCVMGERLAPGVAVRFAP